MNNILSCITGCLIGFGIGLLFLFFFNIKRILIFFDIIDIKDSIEWCFKHDKLFLQAWDEYFFNLSENILTELKNDDIFFNLFIKNNLKYSFLSQNEIYTGCNNYHLDNIHERKMVHPFSRY